MQGWLRLCWPVLIWKSWAARLLSAAIASFWHKGKTAQVSSKKEEECLMEAMLSLLNCERMIWIDGKWGIFFLSFLDMLNRSSAPPLIFSSCLWLNEVLPLSTIHFGLFFFWGACPLPFSLYYILQHIHTWKGTSRPNYGPTIPQCHPAAETNSLAHCCHYCKSIWQTQRWAAECNYSQRACAATCTHTGVNRPSSC